MSKYNLPLSKEEIINMYNNGSTLTEIALICKCRFENIRHLLKRLDVKCRSRSYAGRKYTIDESFFEIIDTEQKAYFLGLLYADGYNNRKSNTVSIRLQGRDIDILEKFKEAIKTDRPIKIYNGYVDFSITNMKISKDLEILGCMQKKSLVLEFPTCISQDLIHHFIRGYFDGDGCVYVNSRPRYHFSIVGRAKFLEDVQLQLVDNCKINLTKIAPHETIGHGILVYGGRKNILKIYNYLYNNASIYLERKFQKFKSIPT